MLSANNLTNDVGNVNIAQTSKLKSAMLNPVTGVTLLNQGLATFVWQVLQPYKMFVAHLQTTSQPVPHRVAGEIRTLFKALGRWVSKPNSPRTFTGRYAKWRDIMVDATNEAAAVSRGHTDANPEVVAQVDGRIDVFVNALLESLNARLGPYRKVYDAMEAIDLRKSGADAPEQAAGLKDICSRVPDAVLEYYQLIDELANARAYFETEECRDDRSSMRANLSEFYRQKSAFFKDKFPMVYELQKIVFIIPFATAVVESLFSRVAASKDKVRNALKLDRINAILHLYDATNLFEVPPVAPGELPMLTGRIELCHSRCADHKIDWATS